MGLRFRKSIKIAPGVRINLTKKGISSLSVGKRGATVNVGKKGTRGTVGIPGSGLSYSSYQSHAKSKRQPQQALPQNNSISARPPLPLIHDTDPAPRKVSILLGIGILLIPIVFAWFTLRQGYSTVSRAISMVWMVIYIFAMR
jgi:ATP-dependent Zn protease